MPKSKSEIRKDYLLNKYVIITPGRAKRPRDVKEQTVLKRIQNCYFCPEQINVQKKKLKNYILDEIKAKKDWQIISIKNIFPAVSLDNANAYGTQEVIIETPNHNKDLADLSESHIEKLLQMYAKRTKALSKIKDIDYVLCFKNQGSKAGASITHAHSQVFATKIVPPNLQKEAKILQNHYNEHGNCAYCEIIKKEIKSKRRIFEDKHVAAFAPYASQYHYEVIIFPKRHLDNITLLNKAEFKSLTKALKKILVKMQSLNLSFNYFLYNVISNKKQHFYIKVEPRDSVWAGVELGSGLVINSMPPEEAAKFYRK